MPLTFMSRNRERSITMTDAEHLPQREFDQLSDGVDLLAAAPDLVVAHLVQPVIVLAFDWLTC